MKRKDSEDDRRIYEVHLTEKGLAILAEIGRVAHEHNKALCAALSEEERERLTELLQRIADQQGLAPGVHPGFSRLGRPRKSKS